MLTWWAYQDDAQELMSLETSFDIEHILAKNRVTPENMTNKSNVEKLGNNAILEKRINIRATVNWFSEKKKYYEGFEKQGKKKEGTKVKELLDLVHTKTSFGEQDIITRNTAIINGFVNYLKENNLIIEP